MKLLRKMGEVAGFTLFSRFLGLARDVLLFASLGTGTVNSAFILAFTIPNLFRRLFGEGALTSSSIPVLSQTLVKEGSESAILLFDSLFKRLAVGLVLLVVIGIIAFSLISVIPGLETRWYLGADYGRLLFPYMLMVCLSALICGMLNVLDRFGISSLNQIWLNISMISAFIIGMWVSDNLVTRGYILVFSVLVGGLLQLLFPALAMRGLGWNLNLSRNKHPEVDQILKLFIPSLLGAAIFQINIFVSRILAFSLDSESVGFLYLSSRLIELPLGVFAIAISTVLFPLLSRNLSSEDSEAFDRIYHFGVRSVLMITLPASIGLILLREEILTALFAWGLFAENDVSLASPVLMMSALGLPFYAWASFITRSYYARQDMRTPVVLAIINLFVNLILSIILMNKSGATGLALANSLSGFVHCLLLHFLIPNRKKVGITKNLFILILANLGLMVVVFFCLQIFGQLDLERKSYAFLALVGIIPFGVSVYFAILALLKSPDLKAFLSNEFE